MKLVDKLDFSTFINCLDIVLLELENEFDSRIGYSEIDIRNLRKKIAYSIEKNHDSLLKEQFF